MPKSEKADVAERIEQKLKLGLYLRSPKVGSGRQTWGGAGVIIRYPASSNTSMEHSDELADIHCSWPDDVIFETPHAGAVARLYKDILKFAASASHYNHLSKRVLWGKITQAGRSLAERSEAIDGETLLRCMWAVARELISKWEGNENENSH